MIIARNKDKTSSSLCSNSKKTLATFNYNSSDENLKMLITCPKFQSKGTRVSLDWDFPYKIYTGIWVSMLVILNDYLYLLVLPIFSYAFLF